MTEPTTADRPRIALLATGGTIACRPGPDGRMVPGVTPEELVASVPGLEDIASISVESLQKVSGFDMGPERMTEVALRARELLMGGADRRGGGDPRHRHRRRDHVHVRDAGRRGNRSGSDRVRVRHAGRFRAGSGRPAEPPQRSSYRFECRGPRAGGAAQRERPDPLRGLGLQAQHPCMWRRSSRCGAAPSARCRRRSPCSCSTRPGRPAAMASGARCPW